MKIYNSVPDYDSLKKYLNVTYNIDFDKISLYRDMIGAVYYLWKKDKRYVYKLYRTFDTLAAIQSTEIISYLKANDFPVVSIIPTNENELYSIVEMPEGNRVGVMFEYVDGKEPTTKEDIYLIGQLTGRMHKLMESYDGKLIELSKDHYIDRFINISKDMLSEREKINEIDTYGNELWNNILKLPKVFSHGDLHTGNLLKTKEGNIIFLDFDIASNSYPIFDVATICDDTNFVNVKEEDLERTLYNFERFYKGYSKERQLSNEEKSAILDCIAIHHYELLGTIPKYKIPLEGNHWFNNRFLNIHYTWLTQWSEIQRKVIRKFNRKLN